MKIRWKIISLFLVIATLVTTLPLTVFAEELKKAVADDPTKPIFVMQHEHISGTVYGSLDNEGWGMPDFAEILKDYPQVVDFSGHSHYPLNDPRSIWQGEYTALGTGGLYYAEITVDDVKTVHPEGYRFASTFWVVEIDSQNRIRLRAVDLLAEKLGCKIDKGKFQGLFGQTTYQGKKLFLLKPLTYMNLSGEAVKLAGAFYKIPPERIIVLSDDVTLDVGRLRVRRKGSHGGHNGLRSIENCLGEATYQRIKMGVGQKPHPDFDLVDWVLSEFNKQEQKMLFSCFETAYEGIVKLVNGKFEDAQMQCNSHVYKD